MKNYLNFETDVKNLEEELDQLKDPYNQEGLSEVDTSKISEVEKEITEKLENIYLNLDPQQTALVARHEDRPKAKFFIDNLFEEFIQLSGDRFYGEDKSVITGFGKFNNKSVLIIGQEKAEVLEKRIEHNFGMMIPEGYRKTIRLMELANKFRIPIISIIDTPGAYPGVGAEERGQAEAIAKSIECCMKLTVPTISIIIGEGGSGVAIALASSNKVLMLQNAIYSVISPEGCATILWSDPKQTEKQWEENERGVSFTFNEEVVEKFCDLIEEIASNVKTRFLVITHHPLTMARMDRLYGITMQEKGVSQLVSVDLNVAEKIRNIA